MTKRLRNTMERRAVSATVRKFEAGDVEQVLELAQKYASWDVTPTKADIEGFHSASPEFFLVAEDDKKIVGFIYGRESNPPAEVLDKWNSRKVASIETLAVDKNYRRRGIATSLLATLFEAFKQKKIDLVTLSVPAVEIGAMKLYGKMGFDPRAQFLWKRLDS
ncbi:GNAT family N-acetyltransferase [Candidatus Bathyarchaeota archaeon]|nr:MAG: GNAT family N-acetyltransferase [Candidatus Bathyarchaeota archaeon]